MLALSKLLQQQQLQQARAECAGKVDSLLQRVTESVLADDRREALAQLRDLLTESGSARAAFGSVGLPLMCGLVRDFKDDVDQLRVALECLSLAVGQGGAEGQAAAVNAEQLLRSAECVPLLLSLFDDEPLGCTDFYVRFSALDILKGLLAANAQLLQESVLSAPLGISRLMGVLGERDALRNEGLLLLQQLVLGNVEMQKIVAFEGAFDRTLAILQEEGLLEGVIVVQDCLQLLLNLLQGNPSNQLMFREMGFLAQLLSLVAASAAQAGNQGSGSQACHNLLAALQLLTALVMPAGSTTQSADTQCAHNRELLAQHRSLPWLVAMAQGPPACPDAAVRAQALACLAGMLTGGPANAQLGEPDITWLMWLALHGEDELEAAAADAALEALYVGNGSAQVATSFGLLSKGQSELVRALASSDLQLCSRAASVLAHLVRGNAEAKQHLSQLLSQQLMHCTRQLAGLLLAKPPSSASQKQQQQCFSLRFVKMLLSWLPDCAPAVTGFLRAASATPFLVGAVSGALPLDAALRGLMAVLLGVCALACWAPDNAAPSIPAPAVLMGVIVGQIGLEQFRGLVDNLGQHLLVAGPEAGAGQPTYVPVGTTLTVPFYAYAAELAKDVSARVACGAATTESSSASMAASSSGSPQAVSKEPRPAPEPANVPQAPVVLAEHAEPNDAAEYSHQDSEVRLGGGAVTRLSVPVPATAPECVGLGVTGTMGLVLEEEDQTLATAPPLADHAKCDAKINQLKEELQAAMRESEASKAEAAKLRDDIMRLESELEGLSTAYAMLEAHSRELQSELGREREPRSGGVVNTNNQDPVEDVDDTMDDLLVCLGREEAKVARLTTYLSNINIDPYAIIGDIGD